MHMRPAKAALCQELKPGPGSAPRMVAGPAMDPGHRQWLWLLTAEFHTEGKFTRGRDDTQLLVYVHRGMSKPRKEETVPRQSAEHATTGYAICHTVSLAEGWYGGLRGSDVNLTDMVKNDYSGSNWGIILCFSNVFMP